MMAPEQEDRGVDPEETQIGMTTDSDGIVKPIYFDPPHVDDALGDPAAVEDDSGGS